MYSVQDGNNFSKTSSCKEELECQGERKEHITVKRSFGGNVHIDASR